MSGIDLHIHSNASDGKFSPEDIVKKAAGLGLTNIALTDHDTVNGIARAITAAKAFPGLMVIPGIELSTDVPVGEVHILGYFIDYQDRTLRETCDRVRSSREERAQKMIHKLNRLGIQINWRRVQEIAGSGTVGRPHIAQALLEQGYITSFKEAFVKYIGHGGPAYVKWEKMTPVEAVEMVLRYHGLPVLAHPLTAADPAALTLELKKAGLIGIEAYYNSNTAEQIKLILSLATKHELIPTGGSDYHGLDDNTETMMGAAPVPRAVIERLIDIAKKRLVIFPSPVDDA
ncbi:MAG: PHP domain-containing protein [Chloroflexota bacterium]